MASEMDRETLLLKREILAVKMAEQWCFAKKITGVQLVSFDRGSSYTGGERSGLRQQKVIMFIFPVHNNYAGGKNWNH